MAGEVVAAHPRAPAPGAACAPGEPVQIDSSPHDLFEGRAERCTLILFVEDATSRLMAGRFFPAETRVA